MKKNYYFLIINFINLYI